MKQILVIGSLNTDLITDVHQFPKAGETLLGGPLHISCGGKGNNQAIAAAKLKANVTMIGALGNDNFGKTLLNNLKQHHINTDHIFIREHIPSATAIITRTPQDNTIIVTEGANNSLTPQDIIDKSNIIQQHNIILLQQEIPIETQIQAIDIAYTLGKTIVVNPAPMRQLPLETIQKINYLLPNEHEITAFAQHSSQTLEDIIEKCPTTIIMTWGSKGILYKDKNMQIQHIPAYQVPCVDTTGAGDTFCGAFCTFLSLGLTQALTKALQASALSVTRYGAQGGMPTLKELENSNYFK